MRQGHVRDNLPRVILSLPGLSGPVQVEFIVDTGFDGELALPNHLLQALDVVFLADRVVRLADGSTQQQPHYHILLDWDEEETRRTEIILLESNPLLGAELLNGSLLQIEMTDGGEVTIEPL